MGAVEVAGINRNTTDLLLYASVVLGTLLFVVVCFFASQLLTDKLIYPSGWRELGFEGRVISLEGSVPGHSQPGYAVVELKEGGRLRMRRRLGMTTSPEVGELVRKVPGSVQFEVSWPPRPGEPAEPYWNKMNLFDGAEGLRHLWIYPAVWLACVLGTGLLLKLSVPMFKRPRQTGPNT